MALPEEEIPPAQKARTIAHMNNDHRADMGYILAHYGAVPPVPSSYPQHARTTIPAGAADSSGAEDDPVMLDIDLASITLRLPRSGTTHSVLFSPPLAGWADRRARLVEMTRVAKEALGVVSTSDDHGEGGKGAAAVVVVNEYMPPRVPYDAFVFGAVLFYYFTFVLVRLGYFAPGTLPSRVVEWARFPGGVEGYRWLVDAIFVPVLAIHVTETWWLERTRLRVFGVRRGSAVWWLWVGSVFVEGFMAFKRFDLVVERLRREGKKGR